jgi:hypothetical protein
MKTMMGAVVIFLTSLAHSAVPIESLCDRYEFAINLRVIALDKNYELWFALEPPDNPPLHWENIQTLEDELLHYLQLFQLLCPPRLAN